MLGRTDTHGRQARRAEGKDPPTPACAAAVAFAETLVLAAGEVLMQVLYCSESCMRQSAGQQELHAWEPSEAHVASCRRGVDARLVLLHVLQAAWAGSGGAARVG